MELVRFKDGRYGVFAAEDTRDKYFLSMSGGEYYFCLPSHVNRYCKTRFKWVAKRRMRLVSRDNLSYEVVE